MEKFGFHALSTEWWHYSLSDTTNKYELLDLSFDQLKKLENKQKESFELNGVFQRQGTEQAMPP